jgi:hypothetical protein
MTDVRFEGSAFPAGLALTIRKHPPVEVRDSDRMDVRMRFELSIEGGRVVVDCDVDNYSRDEHLMRLYVRASDLANAAVNLAAFAMGVGARVVIDTAHEATGSSLTMVLRDRELESLCTAFSPADESFDAMIAIVHGDLRISRAIGDLTEAISGPHMIPSMCARAVETLRVLMVPSDLDRRQGWPLMQRHLNLSQDYLKSVTDPAFALKRVPFAVATLLLWVFKNIGKYCLGIKSSHFREHLSPPPLRGLSLPPS